MRRHQPLAAVGLALALLLLGPGASLSALAGQDPAEEDSLARQAEARERAGRQPVEVPEGTYADPGVRSLIERARAERAARAAGLSSFEVTFRERIYAGLGGRFVRRERALFHQERAARIYWDDGGDRIIRWLGVRRGVPIVGLGIEFEDDPRNDDVFDLDFDFLDPADDRMTIGSDWALHPLADTAVLHYRYRSGDTIRIRFPGSERTVTLIEAVVEPREARFDRIVGSLWFDADEAVLTRAAYRPAIAYDFDREEPDDADDVPGFLKPLRATVRFITVDYGLQELRWWLPNRVAFDATGTIGQLANMPLRFEWTFEDYDVGGRPTLDPEEGVPAGWTRWVEDEEERVLGDSAGVEADRPTRDDPLTAEADSIPVEPERVVVIVPPVDSLVSSPELPEPLFSGSVDAFEAEELEALEDRLGSLRVPAAELPGPSFDLGLWPGRVRYNRVEGIAPSARFAWPTGEASELSVTPRIGIPEWEPGVEVAWRRETPAGSFGITAYRRLIDLGDWGRPLSFGNSLNGLLTGYDDGLYFRETGLEIGVSRSGSRMRFEASLFAERHQNAPKRTDASLPNLLGDRLFPPNVTAERGEVAGVAGRLRAFSSVDPGVPVLTATAWGEAAAGDFDYGRLAVSGALYVPLGRVGAAVEAGAGTTFGDPPLQRLFHLGGPYTLRAFEPGAAAGEAFWLGRAELGLGFGIGPASHGYAVGGSAWRLTAFGDAAWAGPRDAFGTDDWRASVGVGVSLMEGLFRIDLARAVRGEDAWRLHIYSDGVM